MQFISFMEDALAEARLAADAGEVPVGAVVVKDGQIIGRGRNGTRAGCDPSAHAEILAIRDACAALGVDRLVGCDLYVTLEPCAMCAGAIAHARIARLYYGARDAKSGGVSVGARVFERTQSHHAPEVYDGIGAQEAAALLTSFFEEKRA
ncbi:nucleoside deaminase [Planktotalea sp.]|uniref:nucleoside deaminase n=1 Tax=Planktotalea sp. TaxID=2029877 RepID=UPI003D6B2DE9